MTYASFWKRTAAFLIDIIICPILAGLIGALIMLLLWLLSWLGTSMVSSIVFLILVACWSVGFVTFYFVWLESSRWQATPGKKIFGLKVTDINGQRISFGRSFWRNFGMIASTFIFYIGYLMCIWTKKKQCLHDKMAECLVIDEIPNKRQGLAVGVAIVILGLYALLAIIDIVISASSLPNLNQAVTRAKIAQAAAVIQFVEQSQQRYYFVHGEYATQWSSLDFSECKQASGNICVVDGLQLTLEGNTLSIWPDNRAFVLKIPHDSDEVTCEDEEGSGLCQWFAQLAEEE